MGAEASGRSSFCTQNAWRRFVLFAQDETTSCEGWMSPGEKFDLATDEVAAFWKLVRDRTYETRIKQPSLITLRAQHLTDADLVPVIREVRVNLDYDFKRKPIDAHDDEALLTAQTIPWDTVADFEKARDDLEARKYSQRRVLKTRSDLRRNDLMGRERQRPTRCGRKVR